MNAIVAAQAAITGIKIVRSITAHRAQMKKLREEKQFWIDMKNTVESAAAKPQPIRVQCERLA